MAALQNSRLNAKLNLLFNGQRGGGGGEAVCLIVSRTMNGNGEVCLAVWITGGPHVKVICDSHAWVHQTTSVQVSNITWAHSRCISMK